MVKSTTMGTRLAAAPALRDTRLRVSGVNCSAVRSVRLAFSTADRSFKSCSVTVMGSLMSLFFTVSSEVMTTRMKLP